MAPGSRVYGHLTDRGHFCSDPCLIRYATEGACVAPPNAPLQITWNRGTSFATPAVSGAAALVRDWLGVAFSRPSPSPALVRSVLAAGARNLVPWRDAPGVCCDGPSSCWLCGDMRPAPDRFQGWGGLSLDRHFGPTSRYYLHDQGTTFTAPGQSWTKTLTITDPTKPVTVVLAWTDRASVPVVPAGDYNLVNDLDLYVTILGEELGQETVRTWVGNVYYCDPNALGAARTGYSLDTGMAECKLRPDRKNNMEKIDIHPSRILPGNEGLTLTVTAVAITADGLDVSGSTPRQDFAIVVENAHE